MIGSKHNWLNDFAGFKKGWSNNSKNSRLANLSENESGERFLLVAVGVNLVDEVYFDEVQMLPAGPHLASFPVRLTSWHGLIACDIPSPQINYFRVAACYLSLR